MPTVSFRWNRVDDLEDEIPDELDKSEAMRCILNDWLDDPDYNLID